MDGISTKKHFKEYDVILGQMFNQAMGNKFQEIYPLFLEISTFKTFYLRVQKVMFKVYQRAAGKTFDSNLQQ